mmetsp:Transcript_73317/g.118284  ORF Transcript_73317/g.118284 Transcript_73317/m.118284 type:complete len:340 (+) Transcript_73317:1037-2056(+)
MRVSHAHELNLHSVQCFCAHLAARSRHLLLECLGRGVVNVVCSRLQRRHEEVVILKQGVQLGRLGRQLTLGRIVLVDVLERRRLRVRRLALHHLGAHGIQKLLADLDGENYKVALVGGLRQRAEVLRPDACGVQEAVATHALAALLHAIRHQHGADRLQRGRQHVHLSQCVELRGFELQEGCVVKLFSLLACKVHGESQRELWKDDELLGRVVQDLRFRPLGRLHQVLELILGSQGILLIIVEVIIDVGAQHHSLHLELPAHCGVADSAGDRLRQIEASARGDLQPGVGHGAKEHLVISNLPISAILLHNHELHEQIPPRNIHVGDTHGTVVHAIVAQL